MDSVTSLPSVSERVSGTNSRKKERENRTRKILSSRIYECIGRRGRGQRADEVRNIKLLDVPQEPCRSIRELPRPRGSRGPPKNEIVVRSASGQMVRTRAQSHLHVEPPIGVEPPLRIEGIDIVCPPSSLEVTLLRGAVDSVTSLANQENEPGTGRNDPTKDFSLLVN